MKTSRVRPANDQMLVCLPRDYCKQLDVKAGEQVAWSIDMDNHAVTIFFNREASNNLPVQPEENTITEHSEDIECNY